MRFIDPLKFHPIVLFYQFEVAYLLFDLRNFVQVRLFTQFLELRASWVITLIHIDHLCFWNYHVNSLLLSFQHWSLKLQLLNMNCLKLIEYEHYCSLFGSLIHQDSDQCYLFEGNCLLITNLDSLLNWPYHYPLIHCWLQA